MPASSRSPPTYSAVSYLRYTTLPISSKIIIGVVTCIGGADALLSYHFHFQGKPKGSNYVTLVTTSGRDPVRPEALEGRRTGYLLTEQQSRRTRNDISRTFLAKRTRLWERNGIQVGGRFLAIGGGCAYLSGAGFGLEGSSPWRGERRGSGPGWRR